MKLKLIAAAAVAFVAFGAQAGTALVSQNGGPLTAVAQSGATGDAYQLGVLGTSWTTLLATVAGAGGFFETADFTVAPGTSLVNGAANTYALTFGPEILGSISDFSVVVWDNVHPNGSTTYASIGAGGTFSVNLAPGQYHIDVTGLVTGSGGQYSVGLQAVPVPEPETYALMLAGLGAVGFIARRRRAA